MAGMVDTTPPRAAKPATGNAPLDARVRELAGFLAAPQQSRLTEEQRALTLGIARRLIFAVAEQLDSGFAPDRLWALWSRDGIPSAGALALPCFVRAEEYRWRVHAASRIADEAPSADDDGAADDDITALPSDADETGIAVMDQADLALRIADGRRSDAMGYPSLPVSDIRPELYQALALDIAAFILAESGNDRDLARHLGARVKKLLADQAAQPGIDTVALDYWQVLQGTPAAKMAVLAMFERQQWCAAVAIAAGLNAMRYDEAALVLLGGRPADIHALFAPLALTLADLSPLLSSLESLPHRSVGGADARDSGDDLGDVLHALAAGLGTRSSGDAP